MLQRATVAVNVARYPTAIRLFEEVLRSSECASRQQPIDEQSDLVAPYASAQLSGALVMSERAATNSLTKNCPVTLSEAAPYGAALVRARTAGQIAAFRSFRVAYSKEIQHPIISHIVTTGDYTVPSRIFVALDYASRGRLLEAQQMLTVAVHKEDATRRFAPRFFLAEVQVARHEFADARVSFAQAINPLIAYTQFPALPALSWAAAYELQTVDFHQATHRAQRSP